MSDSPLKQYGHPKFYKLLEEMADTHSRKNHDYADQGDPLSNFKEVAEIVGITPFQVVQVFLATKMVRIKQLRTKPNLVQGESIKDSLMDNAIYSLLAYLLLEETEEPVHDRTNGRHE